MKKTTLLFTLLIALNALLDAQVSCDSTIFPNNIKSAYYDSLGVLLRWDEIDSTEGCQVEISAPDGTVFLQKVEAGKSRLKILQDALPPVTYQWKVRCACSLSPLKTTAYSTTGTFVLYNKKDCGSVADIDGNIYPTVQIGTQCWMKKNLKTTRYADGTPISDGTGVGDLTGDFSSKYYFSYNDNPLNAGTFGYLYTWAAIMNGDSSSNEVPSGVQGPCPDGWHVPSLAEWGILVDYLGGDSLAGAALKDTADSWLPPNEGATNSSGFSGLATGGRFDSAFYAKMGCCGYQYTSTEELDFAYMRKLRFGVTIVGKRKYTKADAMACRCIKNEIEDATHKYSSHPEGFIRIHPNPVHHQLGIEGLIKGNKRLQIRLYDLRGRMVIEETYDTGDFFSELIDLSPLASGLYLYQIESDKDTFSGKIVKE